jgi:hypothetical protein
MLNPVRSTIALVLMGALQAAVATQGGAQATGLPFEIGERLRYRVSVSKLGTVGEGEMSVGGP